MANFYFEVHDNSVVRFGGKYFTTSKSHAGKFAVESQRLLLHSDRVWCEQEGYVWFIKHRQEPTLEVDLKEFMWIKLQSEVVS